MWSDKSLELDPPADAVPASLPAKPPQSPTIRRLILLYTVLLTLLLVALAVPLLNINRFQRRIAASLSESLGRAVHLDRISLTLLPLPGLTIENLVVGEDPAFGDEPFVRAPNVRATLRLGSLWRRRVEFSRIALSDPSINLVKRPDGRWNLEGLLLQAARIDAAPTAQRHPGTAPRFPYMEATGARLNLKLGPEKTPISLADTDCALWLNTPSQWQLRLTGRPLRTDIAINQTGTLHLEGTLGRASVLNAVPIDLRATWRDLPLGEAGRFAFGHDSGLRGSLTLAASARGTIGTNAVQANLHLAGLRRADFVPPRTLTLDAECLANAAASFHAFTELRCSWPPAAAPEDVTTRIPNGSLPSRLFGPDPKTLALTGTIPDIRQLASAAFDLGTPGIPAATLLDWLRIASPRIPLDVAVTGVLSGTASFHPRTPPLIQLTLAQQTLTLPAIAATSILAPGTLTLRSTAPQKNTPAEAVLTPVSLALGGPMPALLDARFSLAGYTLRLTGTALPSRLRAFATALPQLGDSLADALPPPPTVTAMPVIPGTAAAPPSAQESAVSTSPETAPPATELPIRLDLTSTRTWSGPRTWHPTATPPPPHPRRRH